MEEASRLAPRDRRAMDSLAVLPAPSVLPWDQMPRETHLLDYLIVLRKHQWLILTFLLTVVTVVTIATFKMKPEYEAAASVEVDKESGELTVKDTLGEVRGWFNLAEVSGWWLEREPLDLSKMSRDNLGLVMAELAKCGTVDPATDSPEGS